MSNDYINREISWLDFNTRVLFQATRKDIPLLERGKFLGISASNLDEFIRVRLNHISNKFDDPTYITNTGLTAEEEYELVYGSIQRFKSLQYEVYTKLMEEYRRNNFNIIPFSELTDVENRYVRNIFMKNIFPILTPISHDVTKDFPRIRTGQLHFISFMGSINGHTLCIIPIPQNIPRLYKIDIPGSEGRYISIEEIIEGLSHKIFRNRTILVSGTMRLLRAADIELEHDNDIYLIDRMRYTIAKRDWSEPIMLELSDNCTKELSRVIRKEYGIKKTHTYVVPSIMDLSFLKEGYISSRVNEYKDFTPQYPNSLVGARDMFSAIDEDDILLHHPFEGFNMVLKFIEHAAKDPYVLSIKQTLYRVSSVDSPIVNSLCEAAELGKQVTVLLELKARFDEEQNMSLVAKLRDSGCKIIYGIETLKTHCKFIIVARQGKKWVNVYTHMSTGNYNERTSQQYTDLSLFTSRPKICEDLMNVFNYLSGCSDLKNLNVVNVSPFTTRDTILDLIDNEIDIAMKGKPAGICIKINSISDKDIIDKLYLASEKGVRVDIICRGICTMIKKNKNIRIKSVVGRFLEHSRIMYFHNKGNSKIFITSADLLTRNLDLRVEIMVPIYAIDVKDKIKNILQSYMADEFNSFDLIGDGSWKPLEKDDESFNVHEFLMNEANSNNIITNVPKISLKQ